MESKNVYIARLIIILLIPIKSTAFNISACENNIDINKTSTNPYLDDTTYGDGQLHILHIACKDLHSGVADSEATTDFAVELVNNRTDMLSGYEVVVHTRFVEAVS